jgi:hypothetical protein
MELNEDYAVFIYYKLPVITRIGSSVYNILVSMGKQYFTGFLINCEKFADDIVAITEKETI